MRILALLLLAACSAPQSGDRAPGEVREEGIVRVVGSLPVGSSVVLARGGRAADLALEGPAAAELAELAGAEVEVTGQLREGRLHATRYRLLRVDGQEAFLGVVERGPSGELRLLLEDGSRMVLVSPPAHLRPGQKVWVQGPPSRALHVQSYGVVRAATPADP